MSDSVPEEALDLLDFWFAGALHDPDAIQERSAVWFGGGEAFDQACEQRFAGTLERAAARRLDHWAETARGTLALIILLDQLPRNIHRGTPAAFESDALALEHCVAGLEAGFDRALELIERAFFYLPLQHAEDGSAQDRSVAATEALVTDASEALRAQFERTLGYAVEHRDIVHRFGRFPHRNRLLKRDSTREERDYLEAGAPSFGQ